MDTYFLVLCISLVAIPMIWGYRKLAGIVAFILLAYASDAGMFSGLFSGSLGGSAESLMGTMLPVALFMSLGFFIIVRFLQVSR